MQVEVDWKLMILMCILQDQKLDFKYFKLVLMEKIYKNI